MSDWFEAAGNGNAVEVSGLWSAPNVDTLCRVIEAGALVSVGRTSDGGAMGVTVTMDGRWRREYFRDEQELMSWLLNAADAVESEAARLAASPATRRRPRRSA